MFAVSAVGICYPGWTRRKKRVKLLRTSSMSSNMSGCSKSMFVTMARVGFNPRKAPSYSSASITKRSPLPPTAFACPEDVFQLFFSAGANQNRGVQRSHASGPGVGRRVLFTWKLTHTTTDERADVKFVFLCTEQKARQIFYAPQ